MAAFERTLAASLAASSDGIPRTRARVRDSLVNVSAFTSFLTYGVFSGNCSRLGNLFMGTSRASGHGSNQRALLPAGLKKQGAFFF